VNSRNGFLISGVFWLCARKTNHPKVMIKKQEASAATVVDYKTVEYLGSNWSWNKWAKEITKWSAVNIYANVTKNGKTLDELRGNTDYPL